MALLTPSLNSTDNCILPTASTARNCKFMAELPYLEEPSEPNANSESAGWLSNLWKGAKDAVWSVADGITSVIGDAKKQIDGCTVVGDKGIASKVSADFEQLGYEDKLKLYQQAEARVHGDGCIDKLKKDKKLCSDGHTIEITPTAHEKLKDGEVKKIQHTDRDGQERTITVERGKITHQKGDAQVTVTPAEVKVHQGKGDEAVDITLDKKAKKIHAHLHDAEFDQKGDIRIVKTGDATYEYDSKEKTLRITRDGVARTAKGDRATHLFNELNITQKKGKRLHCHDAEHECCGDKPHIVTDDHGNMITKVGKSNIEIQKDGEYEIHTKIKDKATGDDIEYHITGKKDTSGHLKRVIRRGHDGVELKDSELPDELKSNGNGEIVLPGGLVIGTDTITTKFGVFDLNKGGFHAQDVDDKGGKATIESSPSGTTVTGPDGIGITSKPESPKFEISQKDEEADGGTSTKVLGEWDTEKRTLELPMLAMGPERTVLKNKTIIDAKGDIFVSDGPSGAHSTHIKSDGHVDFYDGAMADGKLYATIYPDGTISSTDGWIYDAEFDEYEQAEAALAEAEVAEVSEESIAEAMRILSLGCQIGLDEIGDLEYQLGVVAAARGLIDPAWPPGIVARMSALISAAENQLLAAKSAGQESAARVTLAERFGIPPEAVARMQGFAAHEAVKKFLGLVQGKDVVV